VSVFDVIRRVAQHEPPDIADVSRLKPTPVELPGIEMGLPADRKRN
jgi:hypothetical protein